MIYSNILQPSPFSVYNRTSALLLKLNLLPILHPQLSQLQNCKLMLANDRLRPPIPLLLLDLDPRRLALRPHHNGPALKEPLVNVRRALQGVVSASDRRRAVEAENVAWRHARHVERETNGVADGQEVRTAVDEGGDKLRALRVEQREQRLEGV